MRKVATSAILAITFLCGCDMKTKLQVPLQNEFLKVTDDYYSKYRHAKSPEGAISELKAYLAAVDTIQKPWATKVRYSKGRSLAETRLALIYEQLGDSQNARIFMERAMQDIQKDTYSKDMTEAGLKEMVIKIDSQNSIDWKKPAERDGLAPH